MALLRQDSIADARGNIFCSLSRNGLGNEMGSRKVTLVMKQKQKVGGSDS